jgi:protoporphyrinogen oxidase
MKPEEHVIIIGAGPAGLTAAYELSRYDMPATVLEADEVVGGLARTVNYKGYLFDIGGHRFFTKWDTVNKLWREILGEKFLECPRLSRIYYRSQFLIYPLKLPNLLLNLSWIESARIVGSFLGSRLRPHAKEKTFEEWVTNRFGRRLYEVFFKTYTEKVWGVPCSEISAEWAAQRIKGLSLTVALRNALLQKNGDLPKSLIDRFHYPEHGPGEMWEMFKERLSQRGYPILLGRPVKRIYHRGLKITHVSVSGSHGEESFSGSHFISSMPIRDLIHALEPAAPHTVVHAANSLRYRDFLVVSLIINRKEVMPDNWIYVHDPSVRVGRIQNFKNWSSAMVPDLSKTCLGMEYFVFKDDDLWARPDRELIELATRELAQLGLAHPAEIQDGTVVRMPKAYPMYDRGWLESISTIRAYVAAHLRNLQLVGRNGMHKYNNQDHSMITAIYAARNILGARYDIWAINSEPDYHEEEQVTTVSKLARPRFAEPPRINTAEEAY